VAVRLTDAEASRAIAVALASVLCLLPSAIQALPWRSQEAIRPSCVGPASRAPSGEVVCRPPKAGERELEGTELILAGTKIDLNRADQAALEIVPGIGPHLAKRIIEDRSERGRFRSIDEVERVKGIGPKLAARLARYVRVEYR
jgi:competence ComEA-like helix-hairpin-helix protein